MVQTITNDNEHMFAPYPHVARAHITHADGNKIVFEIMTKQGDKALMEKLHDVTPNNSPEPTPIVPSVPHSRLTVSAAWLSFFR